MHIISRRVLTGFAAAIALTALASIQAYLALDRHGPQAARAASPAAADYQDQILEDGIVTDDELHAALTRTADCLEAAGVQPIRLGDPLLEGEFQLGWIIGSGQDASNVSTTVGRCKQEYSSRILRAYQLQGQSPSLDPKAREAEIMACLRSRNLGVDVLDEDQVSRLMRDDAARTTFVECANRPSRQ